MSDKAPAFKFTTNVPVPCEVRFIDIRPGKLWTDAKGVSKMLPSQVSIKGKFGNTDTICFMPGPAWKNIKSLAEAGVLTDATQAMADANNEALEAVTSVPFGVSKMTLTISKPAGERYESLVVDTGAVKPTGTGRIDSPYQAPPTKTLPFDEDPYKPDGKAPTPHRVPQAPDPTDDDMPHEDEGFERFSQAVDDVAKGRFPKEAEYFALFERVAAHQAAVAKKHGFPIDGSSVQAMSFSLFKSQ